MHLRVALWGFFCILLINSCTKREEVTLHRLDQALFSAKSRDSIQAFLNANADVARLYFNTTAPQQPGNDTALVNELYNRINDSTLNVLYRQVQNEFGPAKELREQLATAFTNIHREFPDFRPPRIATMVTGFMGPDLVITDSLIVIGLDFFAGPNATYRPRGPEFPQYILKRYQKEYIAPAVVFGISDKYNATDRQDQTLLADMVYYGKGYVFTKSVLPGSDGQPLADSLLIGYSDLQLTETYNAQDLVWAHFIDNQLLYQISPSVKMRYMNERPFTAEIGARCPGAIGRWVGWRIVGRYFDEKQPSLKDLMTQTNARRLFEQSGYKGQADEKE
nr:gliding motility protein [uncultured Arsenicibacter sp.]